MSIKVIRRMSLAKLSILGFVALAVVTTALMVGISQIQAAPGSETDESKVPHYFGPNPNWALSPLTTSNAVVAIEGDGSGATATATVDPLTGSLASIDVTSPGQGYTTANVVISGGDGSATATASLSTSGGVTGFAVDAAGSGYKACDVVLTPATGDLGTGASALASGGVDAVTVTDPGLGYTFPTVDFDLPEDPNGVQATGHVASLAQGDAFDGMNADGSIRPDGVVVDNSGSGYSNAPGVAIHDGTLSDPIAGATLATAETTLKLVAVTVVDVGSGYQLAPTVEITDPVGTPGTPAGATAQIDVGAVTGITVDNPGADFLAKGMRKFVDTLPGLCDPSVPGSCPSYLTDPTAKYIPLAVPEAKTYIDDKGRSIAADEYEIALVQYRTSFSSDLPGTLVRGYVQLETPANEGISQHYPLTNELVDGTVEPIMKADGVTQWLGVTPPQWLGPTIAATKDKPVRIVFHNLLPKGSKGDLFLPTDSTFMGSGTGPMTMMDPVNDGTVLDEVRNPVCGEYPKAPGCFKDNRATLHLHGGITPWISDGTPHQWITPAGEDTDYPQGVSVKNVPDMTDASGNPLYDAPDDGVQTFFYTNQQSSRLMFYHDHAWGITRLNVYAGEAAAYLISDKTEEKLISLGTIPGAADTIPLVVQDRTFVPNNDQLYNTATTYGQDPTWDSARWGGEGNLWYHHVYMPAQNPGDPSGMSAYGRWMYGPWFWPPAADTKYGPIANPYYDANCNLDNPSTWQYQTDPFCEPEQIPGTPNISAGMEQFNDTPIVNGVAYPKLTLDPKTYRLRFLNAANDRFFNFQWYIADPTQGNGLTEVALNPVQLAAAQTDPAVSPEAVTSVNVNGTPVDLAGPDWIQIGTEGGFLPAPAVVDGQQVTTWITDPTRFDVGNVDKHSLLLAPAERADVIVDFSKFAGKTLILYNDAPAAFPARVPSYDYYTGQPDLSPNGAPGVLPGYGPNTRTIMQVTIAPNAPATAFNLTKLRNAFTHKANGSGAFESGQHPIIVGQAAYNSAYGTGFAASSNCNAPGSTLQRCDGLVRVNDTTTFGFNTLKAPNAKLTMPLQPKAIHDETNSTTFDEYGRMQANLGVEAQPPSPGAQNVTLYPYVNPATELIDGTNLPKNAVTYDADGLPVSDIKITPISGPDDGTQIWRITHNGVDTHPIHFHLYDVQLINRVTWDNIIIPADATELGWKDTVRISPLEDTIVALRAIVPEVPFELPNSIRPLSPMMPIGSSAQFNNIDPQGNPTDPIMNQLVNYGWEYVFHCHILSHEEMDMMRPVTLALPPNKPDGLTFDGVGTLQWNDNSINETAFVVQRSDNGGPWVTLGTDPSPLGDPNLHGVRTFTDVTFDQNVPSRYRVVAENTVGYLDGTDPAVAGFPEMTVQSVSDPLIVDTGVFVPPAPTGLTATLQLGPQVKLDFTDLATYETGFTIERSVNGGPFATLTTLPANIDGNPVITGPVTYTDTTVAADTAADTTYTYQVRTDNGLLFSAWSNTASVTIPAIPAAPTGLTATLQLGPQVKLDFTDNATNETGFTIERAVNGGAFAPLTTLPASVVLVPGPVTYTDTTVAADTAADTTYTYRVRADNGAIISSAWSNTASVTIPPVPATPTNLLATPVIGAGGPEVQLVFTDLATFETGFTIERADNGGAFTGLTTLLASPGTGLVTYSDTTVAPGNTYDYRVRADNGAIISSAWSNTATATTQPPAPTNLVATLIGWSPFVAGGPHATLTWTEDVTPPAPLTGFVVERATDGVTFAQIGTTGPTVMSFTDNTSLLTPGTVYTYRVAAVNSGGTSRYSNTASVIVPALPAAPSNVRVSASVYGGKRGGGARLTMTWTDNATNEDGFEIWYSMDPSFATHSIMLAPANATSTLIAPVNRKADYYVQIRAYNAGGPSLTWAQAIQFPITTP